MPVRFALAALVFLGSNLAQADDISGYWTKQTLRHSSLNGRLCIWLNEAVNAVMPSIGAVDVSFVCRVYKGAELKFKSLQEHSFDPDAPKVAATWQHQTIQYTVTGAQCVDLADAIEWILARAEVRNLEYQVFCDSTAGNLFYKFEALIPTE